MLIYRNIYWNLPPTQAINHIFNGAKLNTLVQEVWSMCNLICSWKHWVLLFTGIHKIIIVKLYKYCLSPATKSVVFVYMFERLCMYVWRWISLVRVYVCTYTCLCECTHVHVGVYSVCAAVYVLFCGAYKPLCVSVHVYVCVCMSAYICVSGCLVSSWISLHLTSWNQFSHWVWNSLILLGWLASDA